MVLDWVSAVYWERLEINSTLSTYTFFVNYFFPHYRGEGTGPRPVGINHNLLEQFSPPSD